MGIILISTSLALLVVYAGLQLLIRVRKEMLGNLYRTAAWLFIVAGLVILLATGGLCIVRGMKVSMRMHNGKLKGGYENSYYHMGGHGMHMKMMQHHMGGMGAGCMEGSGPECMQGMGSGCMEGMESGCCNMSMHEKTRGMECCRNNMKSDSAHCMAPAHGKK